MQSLFVQEDSDDEKLQEELSRQEENIKSQKENINSTVNGEVEEYEKILDDLNANTITSNEKDIDDEKPLYPLIPADENESEQNVPNIKDIRPVNINLTLPLTYQQNIVEHVLISEDPLVIMGKGLCMASIVANLLFILVTPTKIGNVLKRSLVLVLNASPNDNKHIEEELQELYWLSQDEDFEINDDLKENPRSFNVVTADSLSVDNRRKLYLSGGIISVTSRILIADLLSGVIHPNRITGLVVLNVEKIRHLSNESFIVEIYRTKNKWGFIKAFSEVPESFVMEFSPLLRKLKDLRLKNVLLWPRFRFEVSSCLNPKEGQYNKGKVIEIKIDMTDSMLKIQFGLMECLKKCIAELNRKNPELARDWWSIENALDINFQKSIDSVMIPNWHRISFISKQLIKDIRFLRYLLKYLVSADCVDFYEEIQLSIEANKPSISRKYSESPWLMADESQLVISHSRKRVYEDEKYQLEELPKWDALLNILADIALERSMKNVTGPTLIMCADGSTSAQLSTILRNSDRKRGTRKMLEQKLNKYKFRKEERHTLLREANEKIKGNDQQINVSTAFAKEKVITKRRRTRGAAAAAAVDKLRTAGSGEDIDGIIDKYQTINNGANDDDPIVIEEYKIVSDDDMVEYVNKDIEFASEKTDQQAWNVLLKKYQFVNSSNEVIIQKFSDIENDSQLQEIMPSYIIMYEPDLTFIRRVEVYKAINAELSPNIFFMYYGDSIEEQRYLTQIKKEKDAFTKLIRENAKLAQSFEADLDLSHLKNLADRKLKMNRLINRNTRIAGGQGNAQVFTQDVVVVDSREFNASLPGLLFRYGVHVIPCMLTVGDYILTPDICVERKSISDLIGSLQNNRLRSQCKKMSRYYKFPTLLIEFDEGQSFSLEPFSEKRSYRSKEMSTVHDISSKLSQDEIQMKLAKLVIEFPGLKFIWSSSPLQTVNIILELKLNREQPDPNVAISLGTNFKGNKSETTNSNKKIDTEAEFSKLLSVAGISKIDYFLIRKKVKSYRRLKKMALQELIDTLGDETVAETLFEYFLKQEITETEILSDVDN
ncbi:hypothetical protein TPHA_0C01850 [Tetrapisispora phaffii CBS 4417]|uniref:ERCC4 domain-containing protein n=1 Tax=Tetrapisispora phaffii (strain ATCC 24235 / CBS 4417 / NBRC 1672 / NRRL Y-8282 / UCD 70-5) TaxID=1071381 RepID=G8BRG5_TETPH|nr:hypothetical protein TPHA_0C01850 [Tetrapisispora phaffii CBS 4417]CCE62341.1 hypothetical protein TPHA_0C01850 [Tetrapisispora phaffii CBS 4417]